MGWDAEGSPEALAWTVVTRLWSSVKAGRSTDKAAGARKGVRCCHPPTPAALAA